MCILRRYAIVNFQTDNSTDEISIILVIIDRSYTYVTWSGETGNKSQATSADFMLHKVQ